MKYINLQKPHGFLVWRGKQKAIVSPEPFLEGEKVLLIQENNEAFGEIVLSPGIAINLSEFERLEGEHATRQEERKINWPDKETFFMYYFKEFNPYSEIKDIEVINGDASILLPQELNEDEKGILEKAERLPKTLILEEEGVVLENGNTIFCKQVDISKVKPVLDVTLDKAIFEGILPLYQLALVRNPKLRLKKKLEGSIMDENEKAGGTKPYSIVNDHPDCSGQAVIKETDGKLMGCHETEEEAMSQVEALYANEKETTKKPKKAGCKDCGEKEVSEEPTQEKENVSIDNQIFIEMEKSFSELITDYYDYLDNPLDIGDGQKAVWSTAFVNNLPNGSFLYIKPNCGENDEEGKTKPRSCRMFPYKDSSGKIDLPHLKNAIARIPQANISQEEMTRLQARARKLLEEETKEFDEKAGKKVKKTMLAKVKGAIEILREFLGWAEEVPEEEEPEMEEEMASFFTKSSSIGIKKIGSEYWYITWSTNAFEDREGEIFSTKSLEKYVLEAEKKQDRGYFNLWHIRSNDNQGLTDFAEKKWQGVIGRFLIEAGPFLNNEKGKAALEFFKQYSEGHPELAPEGWGCSPEYKYLPEERKDKVYENIWIMRTSTLPKMAAANIWTQGGITMALTNEQMKAVKSIFGDKEAENIIKAAETATKELEEAGVAYKSSNEEEKQGQNQELPKEEDIVQKVAEQVTIELKQVSDLLEKLLGEQTSFREKLVGLEKEIKSVKEKETIKAKTESPKYVWSLIQRASEAEKTVVPEGDELKDKKPVETKQDSSDKSGAVHFFGGVK